MQPKRCIFYYSKNLGWITEKLKLAYLYIFCQRFKSSFEGGGEELERSNDSAEEGTRLRTRLWSENDNIDGIVTANINANDNFSAGRTKMERRIMRKI